MIVSGTGHRIGPNLPCGYDENHHFAVDVKRRLSQWLHENNPSAVISGLAIGWDTWLAEAALELNIPVWAYIPFEGQENKWPTTAQWRYRQIVKKSAKQKIFFAEYCKEAFFVRDEAMIDDSNYVLALWNPELKKGGTYHTVKYAEKLKRPITNFWE